MVHGGQVAVRRQDSGGRGRDDGRGWPVRAARFHYL